jgi:hypothetical protein
MKETPCTCLDTECAILISLLNLCVLYCQCCIREVQLFEVRLDKPSVVLLFKRFHAL